MLQANQDQLQLNTDLDGNGDKEDDNQECESRHVLCTTLSEFQKIYSQVQLPLCVNQKMIAIAIITTITKCRIPWKTLMKMENTSKMTAALNIIGKTKMATANRRMEPKMIHTMIDSFFIKGQSAPFYTVSPLLFFIFM